MIKKLPWAEILVSALAIAIGAGVYLYAHKDEGRLEESKRIGAGIVQALEAHRAERGVYPDRLEDLVPQYIARVEPPTWGLQRWRYRTFAPAAGDTTAADTAVYYQLSVAAEESGYPVLFYDITARRWVLNN